jgi:hypothetical protein
MKKTTVETFDDLDGTPDAGTYTLSFDGRTCEIDLGEPNADKLGDLLEPYFDAGRRQAATTRSNGTARKTPTARRASAATPRPVPAGGATTADVRRWWKNNPDGLPTWQARGAVPTAVLDAYRQAGAA